METRGRKADVTEAWKRRRKRSWTLQARTSARHSRNFRPNTVKTEDARTEELRPELPSLMAGTSARPELPPPGAGTSALSNLSQISAPLACNLPLRPLPINRHLPPPS